MKYSSDLLENLFRKMVQIRFFEESLVEPILNKDVICPCHLYSGEEAIATGICASLKETDYIFSNHRSHGHFLAKGGSMNELVAEIYCKETGCARGRGGSMHLIDPDVGMMGSAPIVAGTISLSLGAALSASITKKEKVAISFFGDGGTGEGVLYESMNFAALKKLPLVFVCENNLYATNMHVRECRIQNNIYKIAEPFNIESHEIDGNDVLKIYEAGRKAIDKCRKGKGPVFLECLTYRFRGHVGPDDNIQGKHQDIRPEKEVLQWRQKDPLKLFERYLLDNKLVDERVLKDIKQKTQEEVINAHIFAKNSPPPNSKELMKYVYK